MPKNIFISYFLSNHYNLKCIARSTGLDIKHKRVSCDYKYDKFLCNHNNIDIESIT